MKTVPEGAASSIVRDLDGGEHTLSELWAERPTVLVFLRHFGWMFCREQAVQVHRERKEIARRGAHLVFVGNGNRHFARAFKDEYAIEAPIYVDTKRESYRALGMKRGVLRALTPRLVSRAMRALSAGARQGLVKGDAWQLGGVLVVRPDGKVAFSHISEAMGDHPKIEDVLKAIPA